MSVTKELLEQERQLVNAGKLMDLHTLLQAPVFLD